MASVKFEKGSCEWYMFQDYWKLCQKFWNPEDNDKYWEAVVSETNNFYEKHKDVMLSKEIMLALIDCLEKKNKENLSN